MDDKEVLRAILLKLVHLSQAELEQFSADTAKLPLPDELNEWLRLVARELIKLDGGVDDHLRSHIRQGFITGIIETNELGSVSEADFKMR
jgi:hypothetical protein